MKTKHIFIILLTLVLALGTSPASIQAQRLELTQGLAEPSLLAPLSTGFAYQGRLTDGGSPAEGIYDFEFSLYDALTAGAQVGTTVTVDDVTVSQGLFSVMLDFGAVFDGTALYLQIGVRPGSSSGAYTALSPRQALTAVPYALHAKHPPQFTRTTLDYAGPTGWWTDITIGRDGLGLISYHDYGQGTLNVAHCSDANCSSAAIHTLDDSATVGRFTSIAIGADGLGLISHFDATNFNLKVTHCDDIECSSATHTILDDSANVGRHTSITIGGDGLGLISYYDDTNKDLKVAHCSNAVCSSATINTLDDSSADVGWYTSITTGADGLGLISYHEFASGSLKVAHCDNAACSSAIINTLDSSSVLVGQDTSITIGADGLGLISYRDVSFNTLKVAHCDDTVCTSATTNTLDNSASVGNYTSITTGTDGLGLISYRDFTNGSLKVAHCDDTTCTLASLHILDDDRNVGWFTSTTIGADGLGLISYLDDVNGDLVVAHCDDVLCKP